MVVVVVLSRLKKLSIDPYSLHRTSPIVYTAPAINYKVREREGEGEGTERLALRVQDIY